MSADAEGKAPVVSLDEHRPDVVYTVVFRQTWAGEFSIFVDGLADDMENRTRLAAALRRGAELLEDPDIVTKEPGQ